MSKIATCPPAAELRDLSAGRLLPPVMETLFQHLETCPDCLGRVQALVSDETLGEIQEPRSEGPDQAILDLLVARLTRLATLASSEDTSGVTAVRLLERTQEVYDFLAPAQGPGEIGRLGPYRILRVLGVGGMGVVFAAEDPRLQRRVAVKAMRPSLAASSPARQRFLREARAMAAVKNEHIVAIHEVNEDRGVPFLAMEFLEGESLDSWLRREGPLSLAEVLRIGLEVAEGLAAAHQGGLIHRDIKPGNIWLESAAPLTPVGAASRAAPGDSQRESPGPARLAGPTGTEGGRVKVLDFGLARAGAGASPETPLTHEGAIIGTPGFMAPEQVRGEAVDARCDLFGLGCVLYQMATGTLPFRGPDSMSTLFASATQTPPAPREVNAAVPQRLSDLIVRLLAKKPEDRPASAAAVAAELAALQDEARQKGEATRKYKATRECETTRECEAPAEPARRGSAGASPTQTPPRRRWPLALAASALLGVAVLAAVVIRIPTPLGTLVIESEDPTAEVIVKQNGAIIRRKTGEGEIKLKVGTYEIELTDSKSGLKLSSDHFTLNPGRPEKIRIYLDRKPPVPAPGPLRGPSPLDALSPRAIPREEWVKNLPHETVAVLGSHRGFHQGAMDGEVGFQLAYSPDGRRRLASILKHSLVLWDAGTLLPLAEISVDDPKDVAFSPDGAILACAGRSGVQFWDLLGGKPTERPGIQDRSVVNRLRFSPHGKTLACTCADGKVRLWNWTTVPPARRDVLEPIDPYCRASFSKDGKTLACADGQNTVSVWKVSDSPPTRRVFTDKGSFRHVALSADGKTLAVAEWSWPVGHVWLLDLTAPTLKKLGSITGSYCSDLAFSPEGKTLAVARTDSWSQVIDLSGDRTREPVAIPGAGQISSLAFSRDGKTLATGNLDGLVRLWDLSESKPKERAPRKGHDALVGFDRSVRRRPDAGFRLSGWHDPPVASERDSVRGTGRVAQAVIPCCCRGADSGRPAARVPNRKRDPPVGPDRAQTPGVRPAGRTGLWADGPLRQRQDAGQWGRSPGAPVRPGRPFPTEEGGSQRPRRAGDCSGLHCGWHCAGQRQRG